MVKSRLYCSEQIEIPETFPNILKTYAKAAIRTQPYDLLRWSAAYFRCLAKNVPPPVKQRLEKDCKYGSVTKGYLKVLLEQVGKGYFISRALLQKRWAALCLPEEELLKYLSVCRMLNWPQVHWLKLFAVMVGSLNETPLATFTTICELLTDEVEGGSAKIPTWMFRTCYTFLAELDCSEEQCFADGRKKFPNGDLEDETEMGQMPEVLSSTSIREAIFDKCTQRYNVDCQCQDDELATGEIASKAETTVSSGFQFFGAINDPTEVAQRYNDFDSLILLLREAQGAILHEYEGPAKVTQKNIQHAISREDEIMFNRELQSSYYENISKRSMLQDKINMLRELGPPWTWIQQFAAESCMDKSFNFIETQSIISDITPPESSDESFDFYKETPAINNDMDKHSSSSTESQSSSENISELMMETEKKDNTCRKENAMDVMKFFLKGAEEQGQLDVADGASVVTFICKEEEQILAKAGEAASTKIDIKQIVDTLKTADEKGIAFKTIDEMINYITYWDKSKLYINPPDEPSEDQVSSESETEKSGDQADDEFKKQDTADEGASEKKTEPSVDEKKKATQPAGDKSTLQSHSTASMDPKSTKSGPQQPTKAKPMTEIFGESGLLPEDAKLPKTGSCEILGTVSKPDMRKPPPPVPEEQSSITPSGTVSDIGALSDWSSIKPDLFLPKERKGFKAYHCPHSESSDSLCAEKDSFYCTIPPYPGIGPPVSKQTIQDFLTYLKGKSLIQDGMVMPKNFFEPNCPRMADISE